MPDPLAPITPASPAVPAPEVEHAPTADVVTILTALLEHGGWARASELGRASGVHRDTARRILRQLSLSRWVESQDLDGETRFRIGPELPRIGLAFVTLLQREQEDARARFEAATVPHTWRPGPGGQMAWAPLAASRQRPGGAVYHRVVDSWGRVALDGQQWAINDMAPGQAVVLVRIEQEPGVRAWSLDGYEIEAVRLTYEVVGLDWGQP